VRSTRPETAEAEFVAYLRTKLPGALVPNQVVVVDRWPLTANGKTDRERLEAAAEQELQEHRDIPTTHSPFVVLVADVYAEILDRGVGDPHLDFYRAGGDSALAMLLATRLGELLGVDVPIRSVFTARDPADLAESLRTDPRTGGTIRAIAAALDDVGYSTAATDLHRTTK
jgi:hypothetical protein